jgi:hypothetical protein
MTYQMKFRNYIIVLIMLLYLPVRGQNEVIDVSCVSSIEGIRFLPDVDGKVVIDKGYLDHLSSLENNDSMTVFPQWPVASTGMNERGGVFGNLDDDPELELVYPVGAVLYAFNIDASDVDGWPQALDFPTDGAPAFGDIDGDGVGEIVVTTHETATFDFGTVYAFEINGTMVAGFPVTTDGGGVRTPVLVDLDGDDALEIIIAVRHWLQPYTPEGFIYAYRGDGTVFPNWPQRMDHFPGSAVAVGDITGDEIPEIIAESYYGLHAYRTDGVLMDGFPYLPGSDRVFSYSTPVLADLDGDGNREIICGDHSIENGSGAVHVVKYDGTSLEGWPKFTGSWIYGPPSIGDINDDGLLDIAVGDQTLSATPANKVYAWTASTGDTLPGFPINGIFGVNSQIILADIDGDEKIELMFDDNTSEGKYPGYNHDGTIMEDWPLVVDGSTFFINPMVVDINLDGILAISGGGYDQGSGNTNLYLWNANVGYNAELAVLPILQYNTRHNGVFGDYLMVGTPDIPEKIKGRWNIFPNPATTSLTLSPPEVPGNSNLPENVQVGIYQSMGIKLNGQNYNTSGGDLHFDLTGYPSGIYWISIKSGSRVEGMFKFIKLSR